jgi:hypothetical protein
VTDHDKAVDRLVERLTGVWAKAMLTVNKDPDRFGFYLQHAMDETTRYTQEFCKFVTPTPDAKPAVQNGAALPKR